MIGAPGSAIKIRLQNLYAKEQTPVFDLSEHNMKIFACSSLNLILWIHHNAKAVKRENEAAWTG